MSKHVHRIGYVRVSTVDQNTERQLDGIGLDKTFTDKASGKDANRPALQEALRYAREGDTLYVHSLDRLARNVDDLRRIVTDLTGRAVTVEFVKERLTFGGKDDAMGKFMLTVLGAFAEMERSLIRERQREGIAIAKAKGVYKGRAKALTDEQASEVREQALAGIPKAEIARAYGISRETLYQHLRAAAARK
jgi:DNA invertase Pin-like site-specific DNA recombinase